MAKYSITFSETAYGYATVEAESMPEARAKADLIENINFSSYDDAEIINVELE